jgi:hypothetical protein
MNTERYIKAKHELDLFYSKNIEILTAYEMMKMEITELEEALKTEAKLSRSDIEAGDSRFQFVQRWKKWIDYNTALSHMQTDEQKEILRDITAVKKEVDMEKFIELCRDGVLPDRARVEAYQEEEMASQVRLIKNKQ